MKRIISSLFLLVALVSTDANAAYKTGPDGFDESLTCPAFFAPAREYRSGYFDSAEEAALAAVNTWNPTSIAEDREFIGTILESEHGFQYSVHAGKANQGDVKATVRVGGRETLVAMWHTHGNHGHGRHIFSPTDYKVVKQLNVPFYMSNSHGELRILNPEARTLRPAMARALGLGYIRNASYGEVVSEEGTIATTFIDANCSQTVASIQF